MKTIAVINQKGGVGKSTTAQALAYGLANRNKKVLLVDLDPQGNTTFSVPGSESQPTIFEVMQGNAPIKKAIKHVGAIDLTPASPLLSNADMIFNQTGKEYILKECLQPLNNSYDYVLLDTPPALGTLTVNALTCCDGVIIPAQADIYSIQGIGQLAQTIATVKKYCNAALSICGILLTRYNQRAVLSKDMLQLLEDTANQLSTKVYSTKIRECISIKECQALKQSIFDYAPKSNAAIDYNNFIDEFLQKEN